MNEGKRIKYDHAMPRHGIEGVEYKESACKKLNGRYLGFKASF
jgi:hypothetical protein